VPDKQIGVALIGTGGVALANHLPGIRLIPGAEMVALCDTDSAVLERAAKDSGIDRAYANVDGALAQSNIDAVIIATPNHVHKDIALRAIASGRHVMCEKPLALTYADAREMYDAAERAGVRHMTAFTYRFVPAMRYMRHLVSSGALGTPLHFRAKRLQDWGRRFLGWRQRAATAGTGELGDMLSHRLDFGHYLIGPLVRVLARMKQVHATRTDASGQEHPTDLEDWVACIGDFHDGTTAVLESTKLATGRGEGGRSPDYCEVNGTAGTAVYGLGRPHEIGLAVDGRPFAYVDVPREFLTPPGAPRDPLQGDPVQTFRYDQAFEFIQAIREGRPCQPSFLDGLRVQRVMDAIVESARTGCITDIRPI
jgi:predicted dehydrogenase